MMKLGLIYEKIILKKKQKSETVKQINFLIKYLGFEPSKAKL